MQPIHGWVLEVEFDSEAAMTHILTNGLDTHDVHMTFTPNLPLVTTLSFWGIPLTMDTDFVDENIQRYGEIKGSYSPEKNLVGHHQNRSPCIPTDFEETNTQVYADWRQIHKIHVHRPRKTTSQVEGHQTETERQRTRPTKKKVGITHTESRSLSN